MPERQREKIVIGQWKSIVGLALVMAAGAFPQGRAGRGAAADTPPPPRTGTLPDEKAAVTHHTAKIGGGQVNYTATAATYIIRNDDGAPKASIFFVAYCKDGVAEASKRPVSFVYNGGPGSASLFTHMGMGPRRVVDGQIGRAPCREREEISG